MLVALFLFTIRWKRSGEGGGEDSINILYRPDGYHIHNTTDKNFTKDKNSISLEAGINTSMLSDSFDLGLSKLK